MARFKWDGKEKELCDIVQRYILIDKPIDWMVIKKHFGAPSLKSVESAYHRNKQVEVQVSPYQRWDSPLIMEGDAVIIPDPEVPFHHAEFLNRVLDLSDAWEIDQCIIAGDAVHFHGLSGWSPSWRGDPDAQDEKLDNMHDAIMRLPEQFRHELLVATGELEHGSTNAPDLSREINQAKKTLKVIEQLFDRIDFVLGNHEGRFVRTIDTVVAPNDLLALLRIDNPKWRISPYYYSLLETAGGTYRITHPKGTAKIGAERLAEKFHMHVLMAHSHRLKMKRDRSNSYWACEIGCCVDEQRLEYVGQRDNYADAHTLGAAIVRGGFLYLLHPWIDWNRMKKL